MTLQLNLCIKNPSSHVKYNFKNNENMVKQLDFTVKTLEKEVETLNKKEKKKLKEVLQTAYLTCVSTLVLAHPTFAATQSQEINLPQEMKEIMNQLILICIIVGSGLATLLLVIAGIGKMFRYSNAKQWSIDILKGLAQVLVAPVLVMTIVYLSFLLFGSSDWFVSPL